MSHGNQNTRKFFKKANSSSQLDYHLPSNLAKFVEKIERKNNAIIITSKNATKEDKFNIKSFLSDGRNTIIVR